MTCILTGSDLDARIPWIGVKVRGLWATMDNPSPGDKPQSPWAQRLYFAHTNAVDNLAVFAPLVLILNSIDYSSTGDGDRLRHLFLGTARPRDRLCARPAGIPHAGLDRRLPRQVVLVLAIFRIWPERAHEPLMTRA